MRVLLSFTALAFVLSLTPASAQMCGGQQAQASSGQTGGMMCGRGAAADDPMADKPAQKSQGMGMAMCPCCKNMAMMRGGMMPGDDPHKGMEMPKQ